MAWLDFTYFSGSTRVPIFHVEASELRAGGAANVALNIAALGAKACVFGLVGNDATAKQLEIKFE